MTDIVRREPSSAVASEHPETPTRAAQDYRYRPPDDAMTARRLAERLLRRKYQVAAVFSLVLIPAAVATYLTTPLYRSTALIQVNPDPVQVLPYRDIADTPLAGGNVDSVMGTQEQILRGPSLRARVARRLQADFRGDAAGREASRLDAGFDLKKIENSQLFEVTYRALNPAGAATVVNLFAEEYVKQNFDMRQTTRLRAEQDLKKELEALERRLQLSEQELMAYAKTHDIMRLEQGQVDPLQDRLSALSPEVVGAEGQVAIARSSLDALKSASAEQFPQRLVTQEISQLQARLLQLQQELTNLRTTLGPKWPAVIERQNEVALVQEQLRAEKASVLARHLEQARLDLQGAEARYKRSSAVLAEQKALVNRFHDASIQYNILKRDVDTNRNLYDGLLQRLRQTGVLAGFQFGNIQIVEPGRPNRTPDSPKVLWTLALAALLGLGLGICSVILLEFWDDSIRTVEDAELLAPLPVLGNVPLMKLAPAFPMVAANGNGHTALPQLEPSAGRLDSSRGASVAFEESIRTVCASILLSRSDERPRVVMVTSAIHAEGKTTLVTYLGKAFADAGVRTLLVEADMRRADLSKKFAMDGVEGLSLYLAGHVSTGPRIHETSVHNLFVVAAGPVPPNPAALLHSRRLTVFLDAAAREYGVVIVDAPPLLSMADARILAKNADGVVLVVRAGRTGRNLVRRAWLQLEDSGSNLLGMVLNGYKPDRTELSSYHYYRARAS